MLGESEIMKKAILAGAVALCANSAYALDIVGLDDFGTLGSTLDVPTDISENLSVVTPATPAGTFLSNIKVEVRGSMSTEGEATNNGPTDADVNATLLATGNWQADFAAAGLTDVVFAAPLTNIIDENIGIVASGDTVPFGVFTNDSGWLTAYDGFDAGLAALASVDALFTSSTASFITGGSNFASSFTTASEGALRVTWTFEDIPVQVPVPGPLALLGLGMLALGMAKRRA
jgi:hypothetical protein